MRRLVALGLLCACGSGDELQSQVSGTLGGVQMVLGGASWAWIEPESLRVMAPSSSRTRCG